MDTVNLTHHFLIAMPGMVDPNFNGTLTYICDHSEQGALGVVINRPIDLELKEESPEFIRALGELGASVEVTGLVCRVRLDGPAEQVSAILFRTARQTGAQIRGMAVAQRSLEGVFEEAVRA